ncbi:MAG: hypothetical protein RLY86_991, partial [Pseudomonadota bacterium]
FTTRPTGRPKGGAHDEGQGQGRALVLVQADGGLSFASPEGQGLAAEGEGHLILLCPPAAAR